MIKRRYLFAISVGMLHIAHLAQATSEANPAGHVYLTVFNCSGGGSYDAGDRVDINALVPEGFVFLRWMPVSGGGFIENFEATTKFRVPDRSSAIAAVFGKIESWFPPGDETGKTGLLLPKPESGTPTRFEHRVRVTVDLGEATYELEMDEVWDKVK